MEILLANDNQTLRTQAAKLLIHHVTALSEKNVEGDYFDRISADTIVVATEGDDVIAAATGRFFIDVEGNATDRYHLLSIAVEPYARKRPEHVGSSVLAMIEQRAETLGATEILAFAYDSAHSFYDRNGYDHPLLSGMTRIKQLNQVVQPAS